MKPTGIVGREPEYELLREFFGADPGALVLTGGPGIGKTTLWEAGIAIARERGYRVLSARPSGAQAQLSFAALIDLFDGVSTGELAVPAPQLAALEVALLRAEPPGEPPPSHAIALGFLGALRALGDGERLVVAIDDVQWLDAPSADALAFAVRRLAAEPVVYLLARRSGRPSSVERALDGGGVQRVPVGPLSLGATRRLLSERLGLSLSRQLLRRVVDSTLGNPLFALELAGVVADQELRARHLALAADGPDETLAATVAAAAATASVRGARHEAVGLAEQALRLTPPGADVRADRLLALAEYLEMAGELQRITDLLTPEMPSLPPGPLLARGWMLLVEGAHIETVPDYRRHLERALAESDSDPVLHAYVVANTSSAVIGVERIAEAEAQAEQVLSAARADPNVERVVLYALAWARSLRGLPIDDLCARFDAISGIPAHMASPDRVAGQRLVWRGELDEARATFTRSGRMGAGVAPARRVGGVDRGEAPAPIDVRALPRAAGCRPRTSRRGRTVGSAGARRAEATGSQWERLEALRARGIAALLAHEPERAAASLSAVWDDTRREGVDEPGVFPVAPELVEALAELGERDEALGVTHRLRELAERQQCRDPARSERLQTFPSPARTRRPCAGRRSVPAWPRRN